MARSRRSYSRAVKAAAVRRVVEAGQSPAQVARELDITPSALRAWVHDWRRNYHDPDRPAPADLASRTALQEENQQLRAENEFLKKARAFFATTSASWSDVR